MDILLIGAQGSGKGTQAEMLAQALGVPHIASGDLFRRSHRTCQEPDARHVALC
jgi:adenylate kinase family enzyme